MKRIKNPKMYTKMRKKIQVNIVYSPQKGNPHKVYENNKGEIWHSQKRDYSKINIGMGWYSIRTAKIGDCILVIEPYCILPRDYKFNTVKDFKYIFTWATKCFTHPKLVKKTIEINHPSCQDLINKKIHGDDWTPWNKRKDEIVFIANNKSSTHNSELYSLRIRLADWLHNHQTKYQVSWYGQIPLNKPYFKGYIKSKHKLLNTVKFSVCCENSYHPEYTHNYFTEKLPETWGAGTIPLYMGCHNIDSFGFNPDSYIDLRKFVKIIKKGEYLISFNLLMKELNSYDEKKYKNWSNLLLTNILTPDNLFKQISYEKMYDTIIDTLYKDKLYKKLKENQITLAK